MAGMDTKGGNKSGNKGGIEDKGGIDEKGGLNNRGASLSSEGDCMHTNLFHSSQMENIAGAAVGMWSGHAIKDRSVGGAR